jgi:alpha-glucosidase
MKKYAILLLSIFFITQLQAKEYSVTSPSEQLTVKVTVGEDVRYSVFLKNKEVIAASPISMTLENEVLGKRCQSP